VIDINYIPACDYADIVLPAAVGYEYDHGSFAAPLSWLKSREKVVEPVGEARADWQIWLDLAVKMGYGSDFWDGDVNKMMNYLLEPAKITIDELRKHPTGIQYPLGAPLAYEKFETLFKNLPHGKVQLYCETFEKVGGAPLPVYVPPPESPDRTPELLAKYPLILSDVHSGPVNEHAWLRNIPWLREIEPDPWLHINPKTAKERGIKDGDWVKVESPHGWIKMRAEYFEGVAPDVLMAQDGWWQECPELGKPAYTIFDGGSNMNVMYNYDLKYMDPISSSQPKQTLVQVSKL